MIFDTRYGNTERIAKAVEAGLEEVGVQADSLNAKDVALDSLKECNLICVGAPTEWLTASKPMKELLGMLKGIDLKAKFGFAFDTKLGRPLSGSAAKHIEHQLKDDGIRLIAPRESAIVFATSSSMSSMTLTPGEEDRFHQIGRQVGTELLERSSEKNEAIPE